MNDWALLRDYAESGSETAFATLVRQNLDLVYSTAFRRLGDPNDAEDVTQMVFSLLARKAHSLKSHTSLAGWLYRSTCLEAMKRWRSEYRRRKRESEATSMIANTSSEEPLWEQIAPYLDNAMLQINDQDRLAVLLRFFQHKSLSQVGEELCLSEDAARMRIGRALDTLRVLLRKKGVVCAPLALSVLINERAVQATPATTKGLILNSVARIIKSASVLPLATAFLMLIRKQAFSVKAVGVGMVLLTAFYAIYVLQNGSLFQANSKPSQAAFQSESTTNLAMASKEDLISTISAQELVTLDGIITVIPSKGTTNGPGSDAPIVRLATSGAGYTLTFPQADAISSLSSNNLYRVRAIVGKDVPNLGIERDPAIYIEHNLLVRSFKVVKTYSDIDRRLLQAADLKDYTLMKELLANGADVNVRSPTFSTPLHVLLGGFRPEPPFEYSYHAKLLIDHGADINALDEWANSPLHAAASQGHATTAALLLNLGADWSLRIVGGPTAWDLAYEEATRNAMKLARPNETPPTSQLQKEQNSQVNMPETSYVPPSPKHRAVKDFLKSPARDTTECRLILQKLLHNGYGIEHLRRVYNAAWEVRSNDPSYARLFDGRSGKLVRTDTDALARMREITKATKIDALARDQFSSYEPKVNNLKLLNELLDIRPKVFYGQSDLSGFDPRTERELGDEDVMIYITSHHVSDPPFKLTAELSPQEEEELAAQGRASRAIMEVEQQRMGKSRKQREEYYRLKEEDLKSQGLTNQLKESYQMKKEDWRLRVPF